MLPRLWALSLSPAARWPLTWAVLLTHHGWARVVVMERTPGWMARLLTESPAPGRAQRERADGGVGEACVLGVSREGTGPLWTCSVCGTVGAWPGLWDRTERGPLCLQYVRACMCVCWGEGGIALREGSTSWVFHQSEHSPPNSGALSRVDGGGPGCWVKGRGLGCGNK